VKSLRACANLRNLSSLFTGSAGKIGDVDLYRVALLAPAARRERASCPQKQKTIGRRVKYQRFTASAKETPTNNRYVLPPSGAFTGSRSKANDSLIVRRVLIDRAEFLKHQNRWTE
jgi:hypothetical protein